MRSSSEQPGLTPSSIPDDVPTLTDLASLDADDLADTNEITLPADEEGETIRSGVPEELRSSRPGDVALPSSPVLVHTKSLMPTSLAPVAFDLALSREPAEPSPDDTATVTVRTDLPRPSTSSPILVDNPRAIPRGRASTGTARDPLLAIVPHATSHVRAYAIAASLAAAAALAVAVISLAVRAPSGSAAGAGASPRVARVVAARKLVVTDAASEKEDAVGAARVPRHSERR